MSFYMPPEKHTVRYFYPPECDYESTKCSDERIKNICKNNVSEGREEDFPTDPISGEEIKPPFLKGLHYGEERTVGNSSGTVSRMARLTGSAKVAGVGKCYNDGVIDNGLRTWNQTKKTDPLTRNKMEKMPPRLTKEQIDFKHLYSVFLPNTPYNIIEKGVKGLAKNMVNEYINGRDTLLARAVQMQSIELVKLLLQQDNIEVDKPTGSNGMTALHVSIYGKSIEITKILLEHKSRAHIDLNKYMHVMPPLHTASADGDIERMRLLIKYGADVNAPSEMHKPKNVTPIKLAKSWEQYEAVELLLQNGAEE